MKEISYEEAANFVAVIRSMIQHEDALLNQRLNWMWTLQGLLFAAASFIWNVDWVPVLIIASVGLIACVSIGYSINRGMRAVKDLLGIARQYKKEEYNEKGKTPSLPPTIGSRRKAIEWLLPARVLPWIMALAWIALIIYRITTIEG